MRILQTRIYSQESNSKMFHEYLILDTSYATQKCYPLYPFYFLPYVATANRKFCISS